MNLIRCRCFGDTPNNYEDKAALQNVSDAHNDGAEENDTIDTLIAGALNQLSINEREKVYQEMHGVDDVVEETPEMLQRNLIALHTELESQKNNNNNTNRGARFYSAYNMAEAMSQNCVLDPALRMKFLRSEKFNVKKSAERMIKFFDFKMELFGQEKLCKDITLSDLDEDDMVSLKSGDGQSYCQRVMAPGGRFILVSRRPKEELIKL